MGCLFDGGDCCGSATNTQYCTLCICYEDINCAAPIDMIGNGICNDEANIDSCSFDGGDCCVACINKDVCSECICHEEIDPTIDFSCMQHNS